MLNPVLSLIAHMSQSFTLNPGDVVMTGTPPGVGPLNVGDSLELALEDWIAVTTEVVSPQASEKSL
jgi:2-keto-4-pentenoate hydratase/2-oxohepta-3-ene-1,7-dioic acid hydratase in catechol pathway